MGSTRRGIPLRGLPGVVLAAVAVVAAVALGVLLWRQAARTAARGPVRGPTRIVSLSPGITETLFAIGAAGQLVGTSEYCDFPPEATRLPRTGTAISPAYEAIARLDPTLIITEGKSHDLELAAVAPTRILPWLTLADIAHSTRELGRLTHHEREAEALSTKLVTRLSVKAPVDAPRVLLVLGYVPGKLDEIWFIKDGSIHGAALAAAGGRNAVGGDFPGPPRMSLTRVTSIDPDQIIVLTVSKRPADVQLFLDGWSKLTPLSAVRMGRVGVLTGPETYADSPRILDLVDRLAAEIQRLEEKR